mgnify:FL=1
MSIDVMNKVIQRARVGGSKLTCLLVMANWCDDEGNSLYPSIDLLAEAMRVSRSQAQRVLHALMPKNSEDESAGIWWLRVTGNEKGGAPGTTRRYELNVARLDAMAMLPEFEKAAERRRKKGKTGRIHATPRSVKTGRMDATLGVAWVRPDSSEEPSEVREARASEFEKAYRAWPTSPTDSRADALAAWNELTEDEKREAAFEADRVVAVFKSVGRKHISGFAKYLRERRWKGLPPREVPVERTPPRDDLPRKPTRFEQRLSAGAVDQAEVDRLKAELLARYATEDAGR